MNSDCKSRLDWELNFLERDIILNLGREKCKPLIIGFLTEFERVNKQIFIPMYLKELIVKFYPVFV